MNGSSNYGEILMEEKPIIDNEPTSESPKQVSCLAELGLIVFLSTMFSLGFSYLLAPYFTNTVQVFSSVGGMGLK